jgi:6-phosphofructokinase 1
VRAAVKGTSGMMVTLVREGDGRDYKCTTGLVELEKVANGEKFLPRDFLDANGTAITDKFRQYAEPLLAGAPKMDLDASGLPIYARLKRTLVAPKCPAYTGKAS